jgi:hypothetical protein
MSTLNISSSVISFHIPYFPEQGAIFAAVGALEVVTGLTGEPTVLPVSLLASGHCDALILPLFDTCRPPDLQPRLLSHSQDV